MRGEHRGAARWLTRMSSGLLITVTIAGCSSDGSPSPASTDGPAAPTIAEPISRPIAVPVSWAEVDTALDRFAPTTAMFAAEVMTDGTLVPIHSRNPDTVVPIGSAFSVFVLGIVTDRIAGGDLGWTDQLLISDDTKSAPPGELQDRPDGSTVTVGEAAELMIESEDNTAFDLLLDAVGRDAVEYLAPVMGLGEASQAATFPLQSTREVLGDGATAPDGDGWYSTPPELIRAQLWIDSQRGLPGQEPLEQVLAETGIELDPASWTRVGSTRGGAANVSATTWLLDRSDGRRFAVSLVAVAPDGDGPSGEGQSGDRQGGGAVDRAAALTIAAGAIALVGAA